MLRTLAAALSKTCFNGPELLLKTRQAAYSPPMLRRSAAETQGAMFVMAKAICLLVRSEKRIWAPPRVHSFWVIAKMDRRSDVSSLPSAESWLEDEETEPQLKLHSREALIRFNQRPHDMSTSYRKAFLLLLFLLGSDGSLRLEATWSNFSSSKTKDICSILSLCHSECMKEAACRQSPRQSGLSRGEQKRGCLLGIPLCRLQGSGAVGPR